MDSNLEQKRRELFELHKAKLGTDAPLMRRPPVVVEKKEKVEEPKEPVTRKSKIKYAVIGVTGVLVVIELIFLAREAGWLK